MSDDSAQDDILRDIRDDINGGSSNRTDEDEKGNSLSKEEIQEEFDGEYAASPTGNTQHLVEIDGSQTLCQKDLREKGWPQSSEPGPFNPICHDCKSALAGPVKPTNTSGFGSLNELRNWYAERADIRSVEEVNNNRSLNKAELQLVAEYIQTLESNIDNEL